MKQEEESDAETKLGARSLRLLCHLVPCERHAEWLAEWHAGLEHAAAGSPHTLGRLTAAAEDAFRLGLRRAVRGSPTGLSREVRFAARGLVRSPLFTAAVVITLGLGIGANAALFTVVNAVLLEPLHYPESDGLVQLISLGAGRGRLAAQLLVEGLLLAVLGGAAGLALAVGATRGLVALGAPGVPRLADLQVDGTVLFFTMLVSSLTGLVFGLVPLLQLSGADPSRSLREGSRSGEGRRARRVRRALVAAELAISAVLLVGAGLLVRSLAHITQVDTGVRTEGVLTFHVSPPEDAFSTPADLRVFYEHLRTRISRLPGVEAVGGREYPAFDGRHLVRLRA